MACAGVSRLAVGVTKVGQSLVRLTAYCTRARQLHRTQLRPYNPMLLIESLSACHDMACTEEAFFTSHSLVYTLHYQPPTPPTVAVMLDSLSWIFDFSEAKI